MTSQQYEELCRRFIAEAMGVPLESVESRHIQNAQRPDHPVFKHQIDLYWETGNDAVRYVNIANAKWRETDKVDQPEILLLQQVRQDVGAHKALMITTVGFTDGADAAARHHGIGLHLVRPAAPVAGLPRTSDRGEIRAALASLAEGRHPIYSHDVVFRGLESAEARPGHLPGPRAPRTTVVLPGAVPPASTPAATSAPPAMNRGPGSIPSVNRGGQSGWRRG